MSKIKLSKEFIKSTVKLALNEDLYPSGDITSSLINNDKVVNVMMHDGHIYVLNHNLKSLAMELEKDKNVKINVSNIYSLMYDEDEEDVEYKMFDTIDDILNILKQYKDREILSAT